MEQYECTIGAMKWMPVSPSSENMISAALRLVLHTEIPCYMSSLTALALDKACWTLFILVLSTLHVIYSIV